jgi:metal-responsive CopG/Arc/MetJ family transcriptional regulator
MARTSHSKRTEKIQIMLGEDELAIIDDWRFDNRIPSRAAAIRELIRRGLATTEGDGDSGKPAPGSSGDFGVIDNDAE